ncbi:MAG: hypothetical protein US31_C0004G0030 [Berkelbacteria bacterium GW2011_GWA1_36_9]|uniref:Uncharacterized protein n=1 Tax=Berkelbacteria bacterium GW2011_GWA1_36_9 TaxID=1618331 RepID=A0A0G0FHD9_9BACT|nr:MAG: hypothetical protein US31_C0004G0030 [Berkelbacteria bacterium GW2011_GWA1_36_9]
MVKSIYVGPKELQGIEKTSANHLIVWSGDLDEESWQDLQKLGLNLSIALNFLDKGEDRCVLDPEIQSRFFRNLEFALQLHPQEVWIDRFRFGGDCTGISDADAKLAHQECPFCQGKNRTLELIKLVETIKRKIAGRSKFGLFTIAFKDDESAKLGEVLGLDYQRLGQIVDIFSPMLYHRMLGKSESYISEYTSWLAERCSKPVLPIIQIKDMPDDLEDKMTEDDIKAATLEAVKPPSSGVSVFWWHHALEKNKAGIVSKLLASI